MKKKSLFFFVRSSCSRHRNTMESPPTSPQIQSDFEGPSQTGCNTPVNTSLRGLFSRLWKQNQSKTGRVKTSLRDLFSKSDSHNSTNTPAVRRNRSMSSPCFLGVGSGQIFSSPRDQSRSSSSAIRRDSSRPQPDPSLRCPATLTPEKRTTKVFDVPASQNTRDLGKSSTALSKTSHHSSGSSFTCTRNVSSKSVKTSLRGLFSQSDSDNSTDSPALRSNSSMSSPGFLGVGSGQIFPSPTDQSRSSSTISRDSSHPQHDPSLRCRITLTPEKRTTEVLDIPASQNTHELGKSSTASSKTRGLFSRMREQDQFETRRIKSSSRDLFPKLDSHNSIDSPALRSNSSMSSAGFLGVGSGPIDVSSPTDQHRSSTSTISSEPSFRCWVRSNDILDPYIDREQEQEQESSRPKNSFQGNFTRSGNVDSKETEDEMDVELQRTYKEAEERVLLQSQEIEQESFLRDTDLSETIRTLAEDTVYLAREVSDLLQSHIKRAFAKEELSLLRTELECQTRRLGKEKSELQLGLERKLDSRLSDWSIKLEKYESEEQRLCEGVTELAEQNVSFQREVSSFNNTYFEQQFKELNMRLEDMKDENQDLRKNLSELQDKCTAAEEGLFCIQKQFADKDKQCKELHKSVTILLRTRSQSRMFL